MVCKHAKLQGISLLSFCFLVKVGKGFFDHVRLVKKAFSFFISGEVKFVLVILVLSFLISFIFVSGILFKINFTGSDSVRAAGFFISSSLVISSKS